MLVVDVMHSSEFVDQPLEVFGKLLSQGIYLTSIRTIHRVLAELSHARRQIPLERFRAVADAI